LNTWLSQEVAVVVLTIMQVAEVQVVLEQLQATLLLVAHLTQ
jgi:hypothetical protein